MIVRGSLEARKQRQRRRFRLAVVLLATVTSSLLGGCSHTLCAAPTSDFATVSKLINDAIAAHRLPGAVVVIGRVRDGGGLPLLQ
jgi:hypothetical protein